MQTLEIRRALPDAVRRNLAADLVRNFGELRLSALGASMVPTIFPGDVLTIRCQKAAAIECGDIVLTACHDRFFVHRVVRKSNSPGSVRLLTLGDALARPDPPVAESELLGKVVRIERGTKKLPVLPHLTWFGKCLQWGVRRSDLLLRLVLQAHSLRGRRLSTTVKVPAFSLRRSY